MEFLGFLIWALWVWLVVVCIWLFVWILVDVFRDSTLNGWAKAGWVLLLVVLPFLGALIYLISRHRSIAARQAQQAAEAQQANAAYIRSLTGPSPAAEIERAQTLLSSGSITQSEFDTLKAKVLA